MAENQSVPKEISDALLAAFSNDESLADALTTHNLAKIDEAIGALWNGSSTIDSAIAVDKWTTFRDAARRAA